MATRCQLHLDLDRNTQKAEELWKLHGMGHPLTQRAIRRIRVILVLLQTEEHSIGYKCPGEKVVK
jgi:hypothetical protein